ncbi:zinc finger protein 665-like isoform X2 [Biomphalaria glabrata]|uniref:Zinc finger protein 665-like isoform X2 n=1 Tax=Biomphalaria glabrata TaxID=6526 RepID=A0A9W3B9W0_BIOGL|nr:zinc finger protein 665-like isoform X2 [Biomphalaria glabrata]
MMSDTKHDFTFDLNHVLKYMKEEVEETDSLTQPCEEQDFNVSMIKIEKADEDNSELHSQQSENFAENFGDQKSTFKQEVEITHFTDTNKSLSLASRLLVMSEKANNSHCVPIIMPKYESLRQTPVPEVPLNQEKLIEEDQDMTSEKCFLANNIRDQLEPCRPNETVISTETCHQTKQNLCQICLKQLSTPFHLRRHLLTHTGEKPFKCRTCQKGFSNPHNLKCHQMTHTGEKPFICEICLKGFATSSQLRKHQFRKHRQIHTTEKTFKCQICLKEFSQSSHLRNHQQIHTGLKNIKMLICQRGFSDSSDLERHQTVLNVENHENLSEVQFIEKDEVMTSENYELAENMQDQLEEYHHREQVLRKEINFQKSFQCQICLKEFSQSSHLKNHQLSHTVLKNIKMLICQRGFSTSSEMKRHKLAYTGEENDNLSKVQFSEEEKEMTLGKCVQTDNMQDQQEQYRPNETVLSKEVDFVSSHETNRNQHQIGLKEFTRPFHLKTHQPILTGEKPFKCHICQHEFSYSKSFKNHLLRHTCEKTIKCQICLKEFSSSSSLKTHQMIHTDKQKNFKCQTCQKCFLRKSELKRHKMIHTVEKPFKCKICLKQFSGSSSLKTHDFLHIDKKKPYQCQICLKEFSYSSSLKTHQLLHTDNKKPFKCQVCLQKFSIFIFENSSADS